mmetsp:Transcript_2625/g.6219  ORF Transcript_2625/g.6219 Transcript_2625/m.6219 type:complete len:98 (+) Transcript_2625:374-667(+)
MSAPNTTTSGSDCGQEQQHDQQQANMTIAGLNEEQTQKELVRERIRQAERMENNQEWEAEQAVRNNMKVKDNMAHHDFKTSKNCQSKFQGPLNGAHG